MLVGLEDDEDAEQQNSWWMRILNDGRTYDKYVYIYIYIHNTSMYVYIYIYTQVYIYILQYIGVNTVS